MSVDIWIGLAILPALVLTGYTLWLLLGVVTWAWSKLHRVCLRTVKLNRNPYQFSGEDPRPEYIEAANRFRDALLKAPQFRTFSGLGFIAIVARETKSERPTSEHRA